MQKKFILTFTLFGLILITSPNKVLAAVSINNLNGGTGWENTWNTTLGDAFVDNSPSNISNDRALHLTNEGMGAMRLKSASSNGIVSFKVRSGNTTGYTGISLTDSGGGGANSTRFSLSFNNPNFYLGSGYMVIGDGQSTEFALATITPNEWNKISIKYGHIPDKFSVSLNDGPYSADYDMGPGNNSLIDGLTIFSNYSTADFWVDEILYKTLTFSTTTEENFDNYTDPIPEPDPMVLPNIFGSGSINRLAKFTSSTTTIGDSLLFDDGVNTTLVSGNLFLPSNSIIDSATSGNLNFGTATTTTMTFGRLGQSIFVNSLLKINPLTGIDTSSSGILYIGSSTASAISIGKATATTTILGNLSSNSATLGNATITNQKTSSNCNSSASPAVCASAPSGSVAMATGVSTLVVNTTAVTANSQIMITEDSSLGSRLGLTCNTAATRSYRVSARTAGTSFTIKSSANPTTNKACLSYWIIN